MSTRSTQSKGRLGSHLFWLLGAGTLLYLCLFGLLSLTRTRQFSPDSMNYIDIARHIKGGQGITQSTIGLNQQQPSASNSLVVPATAQPPLYPFLIAGMMAVGIEENTAALLIPVVAYALVILLCTLLAHALYCDPPVTLVTLSLAVVFYPLRFTSSYAWSETPALVFLLLALWLAVRTVQSSESWPALLTGVVCGLAFATRYACLVLLPVVMICMLRESKAGVRLRCIALVGIGAIFPVSLVFARNILVMGALLPSSPRSTIGVVTNLKDALATLLERNLSILPPPIEGLATLGGLLLLIAYLAIQHRLRATLSTLVNGRGKIILLMWPGVYFVFIVIQRSISHFDRLEPRLIVPGSLPLVIVAAALIVISLRPAMKPVIVFTLLVLALASAREVRDLITTPAITDAQRIAQSERLHWLAINTTDRDLIIGDDTVDIPFYLDRPHAVSFSPFPYSNVLAVADFDSYRMNYCGKFNRLFLTLHRRYQSDHDWRIFLGPVIADMVAGKHPVPSVGAVITLRDGYVARLRCQ